MRNLILIFAVGLFSTSLWAATGMEKDVPKQPAPDYIYSPFAESDVTAVLSVNLMELDSSQTADADGSIGIGMNVDIGKGVTKFVTGAHYMQYESSVGNREYSRNYLLIPLAIKHYVSGVASGFFIKGGADPSLLLGGDYHNLKSKDELKSLDLLGHVGAGYRFSGGTMDFSIEISYNQSLLDINDSNSNTGTVKNQGFILSAGIVF